MSDEVFFMWRPPTYPHPVWPLCTKTQALQAKAYTCLTSAMLVRLLVAFLDAMVLAIGGKNDGKGGVGGANALPDAVRVPFGEFCRCSSLTLL